MLEGVDVRSGTPCWVELSTADGPPAVDFYEALFGWEARPLSPRFERYIVFYNEGTPVGACTSYGSPAAAGWSVYLTTADTGRSLVLAQHAGARLLSPAFAVSHLGKSAFIEDPAGASIGLWQPESFAGFDGSSRPGDPVWFELLASDWASEASFYDAVFGLVATASGHLAGGYATLSAGGLGVAGLRSPAPGAAGVARWTPHFAVADLRAATRALIALGGSVRGPVLERPGRRFVEVCDPAGASFHLAAPRL